jgi:hypothetical protein
VGRGLPQSFGFFVKTDPACILKALAHPAILPVGVFL